MLPVAYVARVYQHAHIQGGDSVLNRSSPGYLASIVEVLQGNRRFEAFRFDCQY